MHKEVASNPPKSAFKYYVSMCLLLCPSHLHLMGTSSVGLRYVTVSRLRAEIKSFHCKRNMKMFNVDA